LLGFMLDFAVLSSLKSESLPELTGALLLLPSFRLEHSPLAVILPELPTGLQAALQHRYVLQRELGRGGMAAVYLARDLKHSAGGR
jgi:serine/threonine protein kinase